MNLTELLNLVEARVDFTFHKNKYSTEIKELFIHDEIKKKWIIVSKKITDEMHQGLEEIITQIEGKRVKFNDSVIKIPSKVNQNLIINPYTGIRTTRGGTQF